MGRERQQQRCRLWSDAMTTFLHPAICVDSEHNKRAVERVEPEIVFPSIRDGFEDLQKAKDTAKERGYFRAQPKQKLTKGGEDNLTHIHSLC